MEGLGNHAANTAKQFAWIVKPPYQRSEDVRGELNGGKITRQELPSLRSKNKKKFWVELDFELNISYTNDAYLKFLGVSRTKYFKEPWQTRIPPDDIYRTEIAIQTIFRTGIPNINTNRVITHKGQFITYWINKPIWSDDFVNVVGVASLGKPTIDRRKK